MAAELIAESGTLKGLVLTFDEKESWTIGRDPESCDLVVEDPKVSRKHLLCRKNEEGYLLENLSSTNPAKLNNQIFDTPTLLQEGDRLSLGGTIFHFYLEKKTPFFDPEQEISEDTLFKDEDLTSIPEIQFDLRKEGRFILKMIAGPNTGAEFGLDLGKEYLIGTDTMTCDIVLHDLSVSREHARLFVSSEGTLDIQDLNSRNGILVDKERITGKKNLLSNTVVNLGTSAFLIIDRDAPSETIVTSVLEPMKHFSKESEEEEKELEEELEPLADESAPSEVASVPLIKKTKTQAGSLILAIILCGLVVLLGIGLVSLFEETAVPASHIDYNQTIQEALKDFPGVKFTYNKTTGNLFLVGHVMNGVQKNELLYQLQGLSFIKRFEDNVVIDESIWQEMNLLLASQSDFQGVTMHSPGPGRFVLSGYLKTNRQMALLADYMNLHFNFLPYLENNVIVEEQVLDEVNGKLLQEGMNGVNVGFSNGEVLLTGYLSSNKTMEFQAVVMSLEKIPGVRQVRNYVVTLSPEEAVVDLNERYPGRYQVTGYSRHNDVNVNVVINGRILTRGDVIDGMTITGIQSAVVFLEKDGLKYKIEYNKY